MKLKTLPLVRHTRAAKFADFWNWTHQNIPERQHIVPVFKNREKFYITPPYWLIFFPLPPLPHIAAIKPDSVVGGGGGEGKPHFRGFIFWNFILHRCCGGGGVQLVVFCDYFFLFLCFCLRRNYDFPVIYDAIVVWTLFCILHKYSTYTNHLLHF